jgi:hypothetical protein
MACNYEPLPIIMTKRYEAWTVFALSKAGIVGWNPTQRMEVCLRLFCVCVQGVLPTILKVRNWSETKRFTVSQYPKMRTGKRDRVRWTIIQSFFSMALPAHSGPWPLIQFRNHFSQMVELLGRVISPSQGLYLNTGQHRHRINAYTHTKHPCLKWDSNPRSQCLNGLRLHGYSDRHYLKYTRVNRIYFSGYASEYGPKQPKHIRLHF